MSKVLVLYHSVSGNTESMAKEVAKGVEEEGIDVDIKKIADFDLDSITQYEGFIVGSPNYFGSMAAEIKSFFDKSVKFFKKLEWKVGAAFTSTGMQGGGGEMVLLDILKAMMIHGFIVKGEPSAGHFGPVAIGKPDEKILKECRLLGTKTAQLIKKLKK
ncbi:MAG: flavodoxin family protein [Candidatus Schekmanbacteria bacterium]|nr:MAG: flavodoxin family protein [Candidatus Schekmanbacteria bacterium]